MIKAVVFDLGGVIFSSNATSYEGREKVAKEWGISAKELQKFWFERRENLITGKISEDTFLNDLISKYNLNMSLDQIKDHIRRSDIVNEEMIKIISALKQQYKIFALTNDVKEWVEFRINAFNLNKHFDIIFSSSEIGLLKPDKRIYQYVLEKINLAPEEIIFIDDREENVKASLNLGIKSFHFTNAKEFKNWLEKENIL